MATDDSLNTGGNDVRMRRKIHAQRAAILGNARPF